MQGVTVVDHPLVQHKLTIMRDKETSTASFRRLLREISVLLCYEVTRDLELTTRTIETPVTRMEAPTLEGKKLVLPRSCVPETVFSMACWSSFRQRASPISGFIATMRLFRRSSIFSKRRAISRTA